MDKRMGLFLVLATAIWMGWLVLQQVLMPPPVRKAAPQAPGAAEQKKEGLNKPAGAEAPQPPVKPAAASEPEAKAKAEPAGKAADAGPKEPRFEAKPAEPPAAPVRPAVKETTVELGSPDPSRYKLHVRLTNRGAAVERITLNGYESDDRKSKLALVSDEGVIPSFLLTLKAEPKAAQKLPDLAATNWVVDEKDEPPSPERVLFYADVPELNVRLIKRYTLKPDQDGLTLEVEIRNLGAAEQRVTYELTTANGLPLEGVWYARRFREVALGIVRADGAVKRYSHTAREVATNDKLEPWTFLPRGGDNEIWLKFAGVDTQYFCSLVVPQNDQRRERWIASAAAELVGPKPNQHPEWANVEMRLTSTEQVLPPGAAITPHRYLLFCGPKQMALLRQYGLEDALDYGSFLGIPIGLVSRAMVAVLGFFYSVFRNYGVAIIALTVAVRLAMFPFSRRQALSSIRMQQLQPELQKIREKYKGEKEKLAAAQMELFRKNKVNPLGGCLIVLLQMPIFVGLYWGLAQSVELRLARFLYIDNLAAPDMLFHWGNGVPVVSWLLGPYFNLLPVLTVGLMIMQQKMYTPPSADPQVEMQQKMMTYMMAFFGYMFYQVPSGLCVYFIASSLWGLGERQLLPKFQHATAGGPAAVAPETRRPLARSKK